MNLEQRIKLRRQLRKQGFDQTLSFKSGIVRPKCSQCVATVIQGMACHETGCPNQKRVKK